MERDLTYEVVDDSRRYALGATSDFYGVWDKLAPGEPLARFPLSDEGLAQAEERFRGLRRAERSLLDLLPPALGWVTLVSVAVWVVVGAVFQVGFSDDLVFSDEGSAVARFLFNVENVAFRVWVGGLAGMAALWLFKTLRRQT